MAVVRHFNYQSFSYVQQPSFIYFSIKGFILL